MSGGRAGRQGLLGGRGLQARHSDTACAAVQPAKLLLLDACVVWQATAPTRTRLPTLRAPWGKRVPVTTVTFASPDSSTLEGLPEGLFERRPGDPGVTFCNPNKLQHTKAGVVLRICASLLEIVGPTFDARYRDCMCAEDTVGKGCQRLPTRRTSAAGGRDPA